MPSTPPINIPITAQDKTRAAFRGVDDRMNKLTRTAGGLFTQLAAVAGVGGMAAMVKSTIDATDKIGKLSDRLGASTKALSEYQHVAKLSGVTFETLTMGWQRMTRRIAEAAQGTGEAKGALQELGLSAQKLAQLKPEEQFETLADALAGVTSEGDRVRLAMKLFDSEGVSLLQTMTSGAAGIRQMREEANKLGLSLSGEDAAAAAEFNNQLTKIKASAQGLTIALARDLLPGLNEITGAMTEAAKDGGPLKAFWVGLGGVASQFVFGNELNQAKTRVKDLTQEYETLANKLRINQKRGAVGKFLFGEEPEKIKADIARVAQELLQATQALQALENPAQSASALPSPGNGLPSVGLSKTQEQIDKEAKAAALQQKAEFDERMKALDNAMIEHKQTHFDTVLDMEADYLNRSSEQLRAQKEWAIQTEQEKVQGVLSHMISLTSGVAQHSKTMFKINKVAGIANAVLNAHAGISKTLSTYPYPLNVAMAALHGAAAFAEVSAIKSTSFAGGGGGTTPSSAGSVPTINDTPVPSAAAQPQGTRIELNLQSDSGVVSVNWINDQLIPSLNEALGNGAVIQLNSRSMQPA